MKPIYPALSLSKGLTRLNDRLRRARPGSVLIIVIVLLLLLAILGAAYISTTRSARVASAQTVLSADVDAMLNGISKACEGVIVDDLNDGSGNLEGLNSGTTQNVHGVYQGTYNPTLAYNQGDIVSFNSTATPPPPYTPPNYFVATKTPTGGPSLISNTSGWMLITRVPGVTSSLIESWLAERIPTPDGITGTPATLAYWPNISQLAEPIGGTAATSILGTPFESPDGIAMPAPGVGQTLVGQIGTSLIPGFKQIGTSGIYAPTLTYAPPLGGPATTLIAGDADGDGIADSLLFRIPGASYDGLTWYAAVRIIDNNSAINMNTALSRDNEYTIAGGKLTAGSPNSNYFSLFQTSVGLAELLNQNDNPTAPPPPIHNFDNFNAYRTGTLSATAQADAAPGATNPTLPVARTDFQFLTGGDFLYNQLIRRITNPGFNGNGAHCQALPLSDQVALAYRFCLVNPETSQSQVPSSVAESLLPFSLSYYQAAIGTTPAKFYQFVPYGNSGTPGIADVNQWFNDNFNYDSAPSYSITVGSQPIRPLLVSRNPVSNYITPVYDSNTTNVGEPVEPLGALANPYSVPVANTVPGMMLPYGTGPANYVHFRGVWSAAPNPAYQFNDVVVGGDGYTYIFVAAPGTVIPPVQNVTPTLQNLPANTYANGLGLYAYWQFQPWTKSPMKANVNTATFRELYRAFWSVMAGNPSNLSPFGPAIDTNPYWPDTTSTPVPTVNPQHQFRSPLRDPTYLPNSTTVTRLDPENTILLRAALAAVNTLGLRDTSQNVISRTVYLHAIIGGSATPTDVMARVYSNAPQPVISEVYANSYTGADPNDPSIVNVQGYVAVELFNPYSVPMVLTNWQLGLVNRAASGGTYPNLVFTTNGTPAVSVIAPPNAVTTQLQAQNDPRPDPANGGAYDFPKPTTPGVIFIPAHGYALLENYNASAAGAPVVGDATGRPFNAGFALTAGTPVQKNVWYGPGGSAAPNTCDVYVPGLQLVIQGAAGATETIPATSTGGELVLLRPRRCDGSLTTSVDPLNNFAEGTPTAPNLYDLVPVDSYDFTGLLLGSSSTGNAWSYVRMKSTTVAAKWFKQFYAGRYFASPAPAPREGRTSTVIGTDVEPNPPAVTWSINATPEFGRDALIGSYTNNFPPFQVYNVYNVAVGPNSVQSHWPNPLVYPIIPSTNTQPVAVANSPNASLAPFGTFARNGDLLDVPFVGAYRITLASAGNAPTNFVELNSLPKDYSFADATYADTDVADQNLENVGRFCPMWTRAVIPAGSPADFYSWTRNLFSYLTVQSPSDASLPNFDPNINDVMTTYNPATPTPPVPVGNPSPNTFKYPPPSVTTTLLPPSVVLTADPTASNQISQSNVGVEGLININTASWKILSMLPMITKNEDAGYLADNEKLAKAIVSWRITHGPFNSIYDLNSVLDYVTGGASSTIGFQNAEGHITLIPTASTVVTSGAPLGSANGLLSPPDAAFPSITGTGVSNQLTEDYQSDFAMLNRISNLITTRSDTFTVYVEVQGWQNAGSTSAAMPPQPVITRRYAYIVDRSAISGDPTARFAKTVTVPND